MIDVLKHILTLGGQLDKLMEGIERSYKTFNAIADDIEERSSIKASEKLARGLSHLTLANSSAPLDELSLRVEFLSAKELFTGYLEQKNTDTPPPQNKLMRLSEEDRSLIRDRFASVRVEVRNIIGIIEEHRDELALEEEYNDVVLGLKARIEIIKFMDGVDEISIDTIIDINNQYKAIMAKTSSLASSIRARIRSRKERAKR